jgi:hypothetical protein
MRIRNPKVSSCDALIHLDWLRAFQFNISKKRGEVPTGPLNSSCASFKTGVALTIFGDKKTKFDQ